MVAIPMSIVHCYSTGDQGSWFMTSVIHLVTLKSSKGTTPGHLCGDAQHLTISRSAPFQQTAGDRLDESIPNNTMCLARNNCVRGELRIAYHLRNQRHLCVVRCTSSFINLLVHRPTLDDGACFSEDGSLRVDKGVDHVKGCFVLANNDFLNQIKPSARVRWSKIKIQKAGTQDGCK